MHRIKFPPKEELPEGYEVWFDEIYYWQVGNILDSPSIEVIRKDQDNFLKGRI